MFFFCADYQIMGDSSEDSEIDGPTFTQLQAAVLPGAESDGENSSSDEELEYMLLEEEHGVPLPGKEEEETPVPCTVDVATADLESVSAALTAKDGTEWASVPLPSRKTPRKNLARIPKNRTPQTETVVNTGDCFGLFLTLTMVNLMVRFTNIEGHRVRGGSWSPVDFEEMQALIGCLLYLGARKQNFLDLKVLFDQLDGLPILRACFSRQRFSDILTFLRFDDKNTRSARRQRDIFAPIRDLWSLFSGNLAKHYAPGLNITVDEQLVPFRDP